jgi:hypothetical protein
VLVPWCQCWWAWGLWGGVGARAAQYYIEGAVPQPALGPLVVGPVAIAPRDGIPVAYREGAASCAHRQGNFVRALDLWLEARALWRAFAACPNIRGPPTRLGSLRRLCAPADLCGGIQRRTKRRLALPRSRLLAAESAMNPLTLKLSSPELEARFWASFKGPLVSAVGPGRPTLPALASPG